MTETSPTVEEDESERSEQSRIKSRLLGNLDLESPEVQEMLKSKSAHESILNDVSFIGSLLQIQCYLYRFFCFWILDNIAKKRIPLFTLYK